MEQYTTSEKKKNLNQNWLLILKNFMILRQLSFLQTPGIAIETQFSLGDNLLEYLIQSMKQLELTIHYD